MKGAKFLLYFVSVCNNIFHYIVDSNIENTCLRKMVFIKYIAHNIISSFIFIIQKADAFYLYPLFI